MPVYMYKILVFIFRKISMHVLLRQFPGIFVMKDHFLLSKRVQFLKKFSSISKRSHIFCVVLDSWYSNKKDKELTNTYPLVTDVSRSGSNRMAS